MNNSKNSPKFSCILISLYAGIFLLDLVIFKGELWKSGTGKSFDNMTFNNWYRLITGSFFHFNVLHLLANCLGIYFVGTILENKIGSWAFLFIYFLGNVGTNIIYSLLFSYTDGNGASPGIYALIACIIILFIYNRNFINLQFGNRPEIYTINYFIFGNLVVDMHGVIVHIIGFGIGSIFTLLFLYRQKIKNRLAIHLHTK